MRIYVSGGLEKKMTNKFSPIECSTKGCFRYVWTIGSWRPGGCDNKLYM